MYNELIKNLREFASLPEHCENIADCDKCSKEEICLSFTNKRIAEVATQAADAIENLTEVPEPRCFSPATNYDLLINKSPEELTEWLAEVLFHCSNRICDQRCPMYECCCDQPSDKIENWLKKEAE